MAGVETRKTTSKNLRNMKSHFDEKARVTNNHSNPHIDKEKSHLNYNLAYKDGVLTKDITWKEIASKCKEKVKELDATKPPKRKVADRKDTYMFCIWCPNETPNQEEFFRRFMEEYEKAFPDSMMGAQVHMDEQHEYIDPDTKQVRTSMNHMHCFGVPNDKEKGCNMKSFMNREWFNKVNTICKEIAKEQGVEYHTGEGHHQSRTIEQMKWESQKALDEKIATQQNELVTLEIATQEEQETLQSVQEEVSLLKVDISNLKQEKSSLEGQIRSLKDKLAQVVDKFENLVKKVVKREWGDLFKQRKAEAAIRTGKKEEETIEDFLNDSDLASEIPVDSIGRFIGATNKLEELDEEWERE